MNSHFIKVLLEASGSYPTTIAEAVFFICLPLMYNRGT